MNKKRVNRQLLLSDALMQFVGELFDCRLGVAKNQISGFREGVENVIGDFAKSVIAGGRSGWRSGFACLD